MTKINKRTDENKSMVDEYSNDGNDDIHETSDRKGNNVFKSFCAVHTKYSCTQVTPKY